MKITIPRLSTANSIEFSNTLHSANTADTYFFDVSDVNNYEPFSMLFTAATIRQFCQERAIMPWDMQLIYNENDSNYTYACHMGFFQSAGFSEGKAPGEASGSTTYIPLTKISISDLIQRNAILGRCYEQGDIIELEAKRLSKILSQEQVELQKLLQYLIREAIRNIPEHAESNDIWICGQYWRNRDTAEIAILDEGIGVYNSLRKNTIHRSFIATNEDALRWAIKPGISSSFNPAKGPKGDDMWTNSGYGLFMISEICKLTEGWLTFVSGEDCIRVYPNTTTAYRAHYHGTALGIRVKPSKIDKFQKIIDTARKQGEETAKTIKNAFKKASTPSKGLLY